MKELRLYGKCPECQSLDNLVAVNEDLTVKCESCNIRFPEPFYKFMSRYSEDCWIAVCVERDVSDVSLLEPPKLRIPCPELIKNTLNSALLEEFSLSPFPSDVDGGVHGCVNRNASDYVVLINNPEYLGLRVKESGMISSAAPVLDRYNNLLKRLFLEPFTFAGINYRCGEILRLSGEERSRSNVLLFLAAALTSTRGKEYRKKVFDKLDEYFLCDINS